MDDLCLRTTAAAAVSEVHMHRGTLLDSTVSQDAVRRELLTVEDDPLPFNGISPFLLDAGHDIVDGV